MASSWSGLTEALRKRFKNKSKRDERQIGAENAVTNLKQGKLTLKQYIRKVERINIDLPIASDLHKSAGRRFYIGLSCEQTRCNFLNLGKLDINGDFTLSQAIETAKKVLATSNKDLTGHGSNSESSDDDTGTSNGEEGSDSDDFSEAGERESKRT